MDEIFTLAQIEKELKKRWVYPYHWGKKQNNADDKLSNFVYSILYFEDLLDEIKRKFGKNAGYNSMFNYSLNRWYNFWSAMAIEKIFCDSPQVKAALDNQNRFMDFEIKGIQFDHKTTVFPKAYPESLAFALKNPAHIVSWLYANQSQEKRLHLKNRLFIILHAENGEHWKLKAEISWLAEIIKKYLYNFNFYYLLRIPLEADMLTLCDIIWAIK